MKSPKHRRPRHGIETAEDVASRRQLCANGAPVPAMNHESIGAAPDLRVQIIGPEETKAYDLRGLIGFALAARITNDSYRLLEVRSFKLFVPWIMPNPIWPPEPRAGLETRFYQPSARDGFTYETALNRRVGHSIGPGESWEGILIGLVFERRVPGDLLHGTVVPARIRITDEFGRRHQSEIKLVVDRSATMTMPTFGRYGTGLFGPRGEGTATRESPRILPEQRIPCGDAKEPSHQIKSAHREKPV